MRLAGPSASADPAAAAAAAAASADGAACYDIEHVSRYLYAIDARSCVMALCLRPREDRGQRLFRFEVETRPLSIPTEERDPFGNVRHVFNVHREHRILEITTRSRVVSASAAPPPDPSGADPEAAARAWEEVRSWRGSYALWDFLAPSAMTRPSPALDAFVARHRIEPAGGPARSLSRLALGLNRIFEYVPGSTTVESPIDDVLASGRGVCQDYAHVMIAVARSWGVPARYVSGYLDLPGDDPEQGSATHAWVECLLPEFGWTAFDPTNLGVVDERYVRIASGRDYQDVSPTRGVLEGGGETRLEPLVWMRRCASPQPPAASCPAASPARLPNTAPDTSPVPPG